MEIPCENCLVLVRCRLKTNHIAGPITWLREECKILDDYCIENENCMEEPWKGGKYSDELKNILYKNNTKAIKRNRHWEIK